MLRLLLAAIVVAYLPGAALFRIPRFNRPYRAAISADERLFWAVVLSLTWSLVAVLILAGLSQYSFARLLVLNVAATAAVCVAWRGRLLYRGGAPRWRWNALLPLGLVAIGVSLFFPPAEYVMGGKDPGTYINEGIQIAQRGSLVIRDPIVASVPTELRNLFFPSHGSSTYYGLRFMGFWILNPDDGSVTGQFPHLLPASIALGYALNGVEGALQTTGAWAVLGLLAVYFTAARFLGRPAAAAAAALLAVNVVQVWFARYPNSELVMQALLFAAALAFARASDGGGVLFAATAGLLPALLLFLRYDAILAIGAFAAAAVLLPAVRQRVGWTFGVTMALTTMVGFWYLLGPMRAYSEYPLAFTRAQGGPWLLAGGCVAAWLIMRLLSRDDVSSWVRRGLPAAMAVVLTGLAIYAYVFRQEGGRTAAFDAMAFRTFGWYLTPWVLGLAVAGCAVLFVRYFWRNPAFFLTFTTFAVFFFYKTRIVPVHFWTARRFLAMALPGAIVFVAGLAGEASRALTGRRRASEADERPLPAWRQALSVAMLTAALLPVALTFWKATEPIEDHVEYAGLIPRLEHIANYVGERDLVLVESRNASSDLHVMALPLAYMYGRNVLVLDSPIPPKRAIEDLLQWALTRYDRVLFLGGGGTDLLSKDIAAIPLASDQFQVPEYDAPTSAYPSGVKIKEFEFGLYRLEPRDDFQSGPLDLTIGIADDLNTVRLHGKEGQPGSSLVYRWTRGVSYIMLLGMSRDAREVTIWMSNGGRPAHAPVAVVDVSLNERSIGTATPDNALRAYTFAIPADIAAQAEAGRDPVQLRLMVPPWNPSLDGDIDRRDLGVIVTRVQVR